LNSHGLVVIGGGSWSGQSGGVTRFSKYMRNLRGRSSSAYSVHGISKRSAKPSTWDFISGLLSFEWALTLRHCIKILNRGASTYTYMPLSRSPYSSRNAKNSIILAGPSFPFWQSILSADHDAFKNSCWFLKRLRSEE
jgi:hypothetical protein